MKLSAECCTAALDQAVCETLESMAFMEVAPIPDAPLDRIHETWATGEVDLLAPIHGKLILYHSQHQAMEVCRLLHCGESALLDEQTVFDTIGEFANTVAGRCLAVLIPPERTFQIGAPIARYLFSSVQSGILRHYFNVEEQHVISAALIIAPDYMKNGSAG